MKIGFIGLGRMGAPMARNLLKAGHQLVVFDIVQEAVHSIVAQGAKEADSAKAVASSDADLIITMLPSSPHVRAVYTGANCIFSGVMPGVVLIDSSTVDPHTAREIAATAGILGNPMVDAPVSGGVAGAEAATLTFMVGGEKKDFDTVKPVLAAMGKHIIHCGAAGNGQVAKLCNNMLLAISMIGVSEAMCLGEALGIDLRVLASIINASSGRCWSSDTYNPFPGIMENVPASHGYTGGFPAELMLKDLGLVTDAAKLAKRPVILGSTAQQLYQLMSSRGDGEKDFSAIINLFRP